MIVSDKRFSEAFIKDAEDIETFEQSGGILT